MERNNIKHHYLHVHQDPEQQISIEESKKNYRKQQGNEQRKNIMMQVKFLYINM